MEINRKNLDFLFQNFGANFQEGFAQVSDTWQKFCSVVKSNTAANIYPFLEQTGGMREWIGDRQMKNVAARKLEVVNRDFEDTIAVGRNEIEDDQYGIYGTLIAQMGYNAGKLWQDLAAEALLSAGNWIDDAAFFSTSRVYGNHTICNKSTNTLTAEHYATARKTMMLYKGHNGKSLGIIPDLLIVGPKNEATAFSILKDRLQIHAVSGTGMAATDNPWNGSAELLVLPELSGSGTEDLWFLASTRGVIRPVFIQQRKEPVLTAIDKESDESVFCRREYIYGTDARGEAFLSLPHLIYKGGAAS